MYTRVYVDERTCWPWPSSLPQQLGLSTLCQNLMLTSVGLCATGLGDGYGHVRGLALATRLHFIKEHSNLLSILSPSSLMPMPTSVGLPPAASRSVVSVNSVSLHAMLPSQACPCKCRRSPAHYGIWKCCQDTSRVQARPLQNLSAGAC